MERLTKKRTHSQNDMHCGLCRDIAEALKERTGLDQNTVFMHDLVSYVHVAVGIKKPMLFDVATVLQEQI